MYSLVICEKPDAARRIAGALGNPKESRRAGFSYFDVTYDGTRFVVASAIGHLYGLADTTTSRSVYPIFDLEWAPLPKNPRAARAIKLISDLASGASSFIHACDYDQEGEVIGHSILEYACGGRYRESRRAKFSTLTDEEIRAAFADLSQPGEGMAAAGRSRHVLDFIYGVNLSRALSQSFKSAKRGYQNLSIGRVQGPTLAFVVDRDREIMLHVPDPYWTLDADLAKADEAFRAGYVKPRIDNVVEATAVRDACAGREGTVRNIDTRKIVLRPPTPFNVGDLQREAYRLFKLSPGYTLAIAEKLYLQALISYPRTSSQKLPPSIGYAKIISAISGIGNYRALTSALLSRGKLVPNDGKMSDPAHPAIYPTGVAPRSKLGGLEFKVYDLIVRRFLATFGDPAASQRTEVQVDIAGHRFVAEGAAVLYDGWMTLYRPYVAIDRHVLPSLSPGDRVENRGVEMTEKFTQPSRRYNQASLLAKMEQERIGTKATRADTITTLFKRGYISSSRDGIEATDLGHAVIESMLQYSPLIVSTSLTREMEEELEKIAQKRDPASVIEQAVEKLIESLGSFVENEIEIGGKISDASSSDKQHAAAIGPCPVCGKGTLRVITSWKSRKRFVGCSGYADGGCRASAPLPQKGAIRAAGKVCPRCGWPIIGVVFARRSKPWRICVNMACPSKKEKQEQAV